MRGFYIDQPCAVMIVVIVAVTAIDLTSARLRKLLI